MNGLCRAAYWSPTVAFWVSSGVLERRVPAGRAHVLHVALPGQPLRGRAGRQRRRRRPGRRSRRRRAWPGAAVPVSTKLRVDLAVGLHLRVRALPGDLRDVVGQRVVRGAVVGVEQHALAAQRLREVRRGRAGAPGLVVALVLDVDDEDVVDRRDVAPAGRDRADAGAARPRRVSRRQRRRPTGQRRGRGSGSRRFIVAASIRCSWRAASAPATPSDSASAHPARQAVGTNGGTVVGRGRRFGGAVEVEHLGEVAGRRVPRRSAAAGPTATRSSSAPRCGRRRRARRAAPGQRRDHQRRHPEAAQRGLRRRPAPSAGADVVEEAAPLVVVDDQHRACPSSGWCATAS